jgi:hypothetical protein
MGKRLRKRDLLNEIERARIRRWRRSQAKRT